MPSRMLIVPAAGRGSRLDADRPKFLVPLLGAPLIDHVLTTLAPHAETVAVVVSPADRKRARHHFAETRWPVHLLEQAIPTGMLDALLTAHTSTERMRPDRIWISWCDQVALSPATVEALAAWEDDAPDVAAIVPVIERATPYIHFDCDDRGRLLAVRQRREGDTMPDHGVADAGLFSLSYDAFVTRLPQFAATVSPGSLTGERNFLPFLPWLARSFDVRTFTIPADEALGINTPADLEAAERLLARRSEK